MEENEMENPRTGLEIAVIGMVGRFPGAANIDRFWENLKSGRESISFFSDEEIENSEIQPGANYPGAYVKAYGWLEAIEAFDHAFFAYTPLETEVMDPQIRILHEVAVEALENAGYDPSTSKKLIGLYAGASGSFGWQIRVAWSGKSDILGLFPSEQLNDKDYLATRIANKLNLNGPAVTFDTACSTALVAIHLACQGLLSGDCDMALAGGVSVRLLDKTAYLYEEGMLNSPDGHCRAFDARARGTNFGNGVGLVVLKRLDDALADGDTLHAVIKGTSINNDGARKAGYTAPSVEGQADVIRTALQMAEIEPETISYVETHGTATPLGDPVEIEGLKAAFASDKRHFCRIGSVKTNLGHLEAAAGAAGFIKTVLALKHRLIPPSLFFEEISPKIDLENSPFIVNTVPYPWQQDTDSYPRRAGVSSFGIGGTNAHILLEEAPPAVNGEDEEDREYQLILLSAKTPSALEKMAQNLAEHLRVNPELNLADAAYTLQIGRQRFKHRGMLVSPTVQDAVAGLTSGPAPTGKMKTHVSPQDNRPVVFMFPGLGSQYVNMGRELYEQEPLFRQELDRCFEILQTLTDHDIKAILYPPAGSNKSDQSDQSDISDRSDRSDSSDTSDLSDFEAAQLAVFIVEYSLAKLLMHWGIHPYAMIGYSFGEYAAACLAGVFTLEDALKVVVARGRLLQNTAAGAMLSVPLSREELLPLLNPDQEIALAIDNGSSCVVAGPVAAADRFEKRMKEKKLMCMRVPGSHALHSPSMRPILTEFEEILRPFTLNKPGIPYISNVTGHWITEAQAADPGYWGRHLSHTVQFAGGMKELLKEPGCVYLEVGPGRDISTLVLRYLENERDKDHRLLNLVRHPRQKVPDLAFLLDKIGMLWIFGHSFDWPAFYSHRARRRIPLPTYPFERQSFWLEAPRITKEMVQLSRESQRRPAADFADWFYVPTWIRSLLPLSRPNSTPRQHRCLVFLGDGPGVGPLLVKYLRQEGHGVITVTRGPGFGETSPGAYVMDPQQIEHYQRLFEHLGPRGEIPTRLVHLWGVTGNASSGAEPAAPGGDWSEEAQDLGFYSLLGIARAVGKTPAAELPRVIVVTAGVQEVSGEERLNPEKATVMGPLKVIPQEFPGLHCRGIDIVPPAPGSRQEKSLVRQLVKEISSDCSDAVVAYRGNFRWTQLFKPLHLDQGVENRSKLREKGVYLVTGGLGKIGLMLAAYLAQEVKARLILTGRSAFPPREQWEQLPAPGSTPGQTDPVLEKINQLKRLEQAGAKILVFSVDAADQEQMRHVIARAQQEFGPVNGVIHCAGVMKGESFSGIQALTKPVCQEEQFRPKVHGLRVIEALFRDRPLDFYWVVSSISTVLGGLGLAAYAAANSFMDVFVKKQNREMPGKWISMDWDGMSAEQTRAGFLRSLSLEHIDQVVAANGGNLQERIERWVNPDSPAGADKTTPAADTAANRPAAPSLRPRPVLTNPYAPPKNELEQALAGIWQRLLGFRQLGVQDDFIELGGDSLRAITMINRVNKELNVLVPLADFFKTPTLEWLAGYIGEAEKGTCRAAVPVEKKEYYPLSPGQKRLYILHQVDPVTIGYNLAAALLLPGNADMEKVKESLRVLIRRHESFRTSFHMIKGEPVQRIHEEVDFEIEWFGLGNKAEGSQEKLGTVESGSGLKMFIRPFALSRAPLLRAAVLENESGQPILVVDMHHIVHDGISQTILLREFAAGYAGEELAPLILRYKDYAQWRHGQTGSEAIKKQETYWLEQFRGPIPVLNLPYDYSRPVMQSFAGSTVGFEIGEKETKELKALARSNDATLFMVLLAIYYLFLSRLSGQEDIVVGTPEAGRGHPDLQPVIGFFLSTLALRNFPAAGKSFDSFLKEVKGRSLEAFENRDYPFENLVEQAAVKRDLSRSPLFDVMFIFHTQWTPAPGDAPGTAGSPRETTDRLTMKSYFYEKNTSEFDLTLIGYDRGDRLGFSFEYCTALFKPETSRRFRDYFQALVAAVLQNPRQSIAEMEILPGSEKQRLLVEFNRTALEYARDKTIHGLFADQVERTPDQVALVGKFQITNKVVPFGQVSNAGGEGQLSYRELQEKAGVLAVRLQEKGVKPGVIVGILVQRTTAMMTGLLGILKAGGAYLPLDPEYPEARIRYILEKSDTTLLLTQGNLILPGETAYKGEIIDIFAESGFKQDEAMKKTDGTGPYVSARDLAYVIFTSGSTGNPKGIAVRHSNAVNFIAGMTALVDFSSGSTMLALTTISFDIFFLETLLPVTRGLKVVIADEGRQKDPGLLGAWLTRNRVDMVQLTPSRLHLMVNLDKGFTHWEGIEIMLVGGEAFPGHLLERVKEKFPGKIYNVYGPTETTIWSTVKELSRCGPEGLTIGTPIANTRVYIVDRLNRLQPLGVAGELLIGGDGVAAGYLNNPGLTGERFINYKIQITNYNDQNNKGNKKLLRGVQGGGFLEKSPPGRRRQKVYRTGDLARWLADGEIEFLGRVDHQVKIRGYRIELEEIEEQLLAQENIKEAVVTARTDHSGERYLCAYVVAGGGQGLAPALAVPELRKILAGRLPDYMIPSYFVPLEKIPLTPNHKIDRDALPEPDRALVPMGIYLAPKTSSEKILAEIWKELLQVEKVGVRDNFFDLGGNSLKVIQLNRKLVESFGIDIPVAVMFRNLTIDFLDRYLSQDQPEKKRAESKKRTEAFEKSKNTFKDTIGKLRGG